ncbi:MAG: hypothetical protein ICV80_17785 [Microcoleus sp. T1-bin1]|nr:hypothetical protein [Microcoleus sp. T1-bin1]
MHCEPLEVSLDSFCEWARCPAQWYEPVALLEPSEVMELSPVLKSSSTSNFFILTFGRLGDRWNGNDEPPDTGIFARPTQKRPRVRPERGNRMSTASQSSIPKISRNYSISSSLAAERKPARSPPGGDAF